MLLGLSIVAFIFFTILIENKATITRQDKIIQQYKDEEKDIADRNAFAEKAIAFKKQIAAEDIAIMREKAKSELAEYQTQIDGMRKELAVLNTLRSNISALPYLAGVFADFETHGFEVYARSLEWGDNVERRKKIKSIREIRKEAQELISKYKTAQYQLDYAIKMFPALEDFLETDYRTLPSIQLSDVASDNHDAVRDYLSKEEYAKLSTTEKNQLALDRYRESRRKSNWQIGRDYELYVGYKYESKGYSVDYYGSVNKLEDLGRDLVCKKGNLTLIVQCKYWSSKKQIHEKHINQLYGTMKCYCFENGIPQDSVRGVLVTNITLSETAKKFATYLGIEVAEKFALGEYPCIKCNINHSAQGGSTKIYHLPFDQQYDACQINKPGEFMAMTVVEAEAAGFRRAYRWHSN